MVLAQGFQEEEGPAGSYSKTTNWGIWFLSLYHCFLLPYPKYHLLKGVMNAHSSIQWFLFYWKWHICGIIFPRCILLHVFKCRVRYSAGSNRRRTCRHSDIGIEGKTNLKVRVRITLCGCGIKGRPQLPLIRVSWWRGGEHHSMKSFLSKHHLNTTQCGLHRDSVRPKNKWMFHEVHTK